MVNPSRDPNSTPFTFIDDVSQLPKLAEAITNSIRVAVDTETYKGPTFTDGVWSNIRVASVAVKYADGTYASFAIDYRDVPASEMKKVLALIDVADAWNANFDDKVLRLIDTPVKAWRDAMFTDGLLNTGSAGFDFWHPLSWAAMRYLGIEMSGKGTVQTSYTQHDDLSEEQKRYPGNDALITLWVAEELDALAELAGISVAVDNDQAARPFILSMMNNGFPFDAEDWDRESVDVHRKALADSLRLITEITGGGEMTLFGETDTPTWDVNSDKELRNALNHWAEAAVRAQHGGNLMGQADRVDKITLKQIDHPLAKAILDYREHSKVVTTYGDNLKEFLGEDSRVRAVYRQGGVVATGRLASEKPNAQNLDPGMKHYMRPHARVDNAGAEHKRVVVHADLSQAEVRVLAQLSGEENLINLFKQGGDFHTLNAGKMFRVDMDALKESDPEKFVQYRSTTKGTSFGIPYGLSAPTLATNLTVNMKVPTTTPEAQAHIKSYLTANPKVDGWLDERDSFMKRLASSPPPADWEATFELYDLRELADPKRRAFKGMNKRFPTMLELSEMIMSDHDLNEKLAASLGREPSSEEFSEERERQVKELIWAYNFNAPVVLGPDGSPIAWESRTPTGRRRIFTVPVDRVSRAQKGKFEGVLTSFAISVATTDKVAGAAMRDEFASIFNINLPRGTDRCPKKAGESPQQYRSRVSEFRRVERVDALKAFEGKNRHLKRELLRFLVNKMGWSAVSEFLLTPALGSQISSMTNQYRNHPIQGLVADIVLEAMALIHTALSEFEHAFPIQQVHDSIAIECDAKDAKAIETLLKDYLEASMSKWCPDVPAKADADIRSSLSDKDLISDEELQKLISA